MPQTLEQRMDAVEKQVTALSDALMRSSHARKDWRATFGLSKDDSDFDEMIRLGRAYRRGASNGNTRANS